MSLYWSPEPNLGLWLQQACVMYLVLPLKIMQIFSCFQYISLLLCSRWYVLSYIYCVHIYYVPVIALNILYVPNLFILSIPAIIVPSAAIHGVTKSQTQLSDWTKLNWTEFCPEFNHLLLPRCLGPCPAHRKCYISVLPKSPMK